MTMNIAGDYSRFYRGTQSLQSYGSGGGLITLKDTLVKYEISTKDEQGNTIMDQPSKEEVLQMMKDISAQYGDNVLVEFSGDGLAALADSVKAQSRKCSTELTEEEKALQAQKQAEFDKAIVHLENTHRLIIPNIQTNEKLYGSLEKADENVVKAANGIIKNYLMPSNVAGMSEAQRREMIAFGMEEAKYLAANYLDEEHGRDFLSAMETIAKYGMNGTVAEDGRVSYHIEQGPLVGAPDDYVNQNDILKAKAPGLYQEMQELNQRIINGETGWGRKFIELQKRINQVLNGESSTFSKSLNRNLTHYEEAVSEYKDWKSQIEKTQLPTVFRDVKYNDFQSFLDSLQNQGCLSNTWISDSVNRFMKWIGVNI